MKRSLAVIGGSVESGHVVRHVAATTPLRFGHYSAKGDNNWTWVSWILFSGHCSSGPRIVRYAQGISDRSEGR